MLEPMFHPKDHNYLPGPYHDEEQKTREVSAVLVIFSRLQYGSTFIRQPVPLLAAARLIGDGHFKNIGIQKRPQDISAKTGPVGLSCDLH